MKHLKKHWSAQPISILLSLLMALPVLCLLLQAAPASAQAIGARQPVWAILDFANPSGYGSSDVGRLASDSFVIQLAKLNRYTVLPREQLLTGIQNESLTPPLNLSSIERLGQSLGVDAIVAGEISSISFSRDRRQARVSIAVRVIDPKSGFLLNGALATGLSNPRPIPVDDEEQLVNEAFGNAAFNATRQLSKFNLPVATVLISGNNTLNGHNVTVTINKGTRDGLYPGLDMLVSRGGRYVGTIKVAEPTDNDANAEITDLGLGIEPGDRCTAIFHMPSYSVDKETGSYNTATSADLSADAPTIPSHNSAFRGVTGLLLAVISGGLLLAAIHSGHNGDNSLGGANVSGVSAVSGLSASIGGPSNIPVGFPAAGSFLPVTVKITANIGNIDQSNFLEFHVYRSDSPPLLSNASNLVTIGVAGTTGGGTATATTGTTTGTTGTNGVTSIGFSGFGQVPIFSQAGKSLQVFDDFNLKLGVVATKPDPSNNINFLQIAITTLNLTTTTTGSAAAFINGIPGTGLNFGQRVSYAVEGLYIQPATYSTGTTTNSTGINPGTGNTSSTNTNTSTSTSTATTTGTTGTTGTTTGTSTGTTNTSGSTNTSGNTTGLQGHAQTYQLTSLRNSNFITYIEPVAISQSDVTSTGSANVNITVPATAGANDYELQISSDPGFSSNTRTYKAPAGAYAIGTTTVDPITGTLNNPNQFGQTNISVATGTAVVFNNINLTTDFPGSTTLFFRVGARNSADNGQSNFSNDYIFDNPLSLPSGLSGASLRSSIQQGVQIQHRGRF